MAWILLETKKHSYFRDNQISITKTRFNFKKEVLDMINAPYVKIYEDKERNMLGIEGSNNPNDKLISTLKQNKNSFVITLQNHKYKIGFYDLTKEDNKVVMTGVFNGTI